MRNADGPSPTADGHRKSSYPRRPIYRLAPLTPIIAKIVEDTETVFWSILEGGLCLLAVNLPSLTALVRPVSSRTSQMVASIRSALSLRSLGSGSHNSSRSKIQVVGDASGGVCDGADRSADSSQVQIRGIKRSRSGEWHHLREIDSLETGAGYESKSAKGHNDMV